MVKLSPVGKFWITYLIILAVVLFYIIDALCDPFLESPCASEDDLAYYLVTGLGKDGEHILPYLTGDCKKLRFDLSHLLPGQYDATVQACDTSDNCSEFTRYQLVVSTRVKLKQHELNTSSLVLEITYLGVEPDWR